MPSISNGDFGERKPKMSESELTRLIDVFRKTSPSATRREFMRWSAVAAGAVATARSGIVSASSARPRVSVSRFQEADVQTDVSITIPFDPYGQEVTLDPHRTVNWGPFWAMFPNVWGGLLRYDQNGKVERDLAEDFTVSDDGTVYTFTIQPDLLFASGNAVTADAFVSSWKRALNPDSLSPMAEFYSLVQGYQDFVQGDSEEIGFQALDDRTVEITLSEPFNYFPSMMASYVWSVVDPAVLEFLGDEEFLFGGAGTGPWQFSDFDPSTQLVMTPNTNHYAGNSPSLSQLVWKFLTGPDAAATALDLYRSDEAVSADVPLSLKASVEGDHSLSPDLIKISPQGSVRAIGMDFNQPPFNDARVRRAVAQAIDRDLWANGIWEGTWAPASSFSPPVLADIAGYQAPAALEFDPAAASSQLSDAGFANGEGLPTITYYEPSEDSDSDKARMQALLEMIQENSGIQIAHDTSLSTQEIADQEVDTGGRQFDVVWWWNLYETPHLMSEVASPDSRYMQGVFNWNTELEATGDFDPGTDAGTFQDLCDEADRETDASARNEKYAQAEELLLKNAVYVPLGYWIQMFVQKPYLQGTKQGPWTGRIPVWFDKDVVVTAT
jgi:ABC-type transport system substrate-binding protein